MWMRNSSVLFLAFTLSAAPVAWAQEEFDVEELRTRYVTAFNAGDASELSAVFAEDAVIMPPEADVVEGRAGIENHFGGLFEQASPSGLTIESRETREVGDAYLDLGTYSMTASGPDGQPSTLAGDYMVLIERGENDQWVITRHIWNQDLTGMPQ